VFPVSAQTYKAFLPAMIANNHGHLVSISSSAGLIGVNGLAGALSPSHHIMHVTCVKAAFRYKLFVHGQIQEMTIGSPF